MFRALFPRGGAPRLVARRVVAPRSRRRPLLALGSVSLASAFTGARLAAARTARVGRARSCGRCRSGGCRSKDLRDICVRYLWLALAGPCTARGPLTPRPIAARCAGRRLVARRTVSMRRARRLAAPRTVALLLTWRFAAPWAVAMRPARRLAAPWPIAARRPGRRLVPRAVAMRRPRWFAAPWAIAAGLAGRRLVAICLRPLLEPRARILVRAAGAPAASALLSLRPRPPLSGLRCFGRLPQAPARKPLEHDVLVRPSELVKRGQQLFLLARAERGRLPVDQNRPERVARGHSFDCPTETTGIS